MKKNSASSWGDLRPRVLSAIVMAIVAGLAIWFGGGVFVALIASVIGAAIWELCRILDAKSGKNVVLIGVFFAASLVVFSFLDQSEFGRVNLIKYSLCLLPVVLILAYRNFAPNKLLFITYLTFILLAGLGFLAMGKTPFLLWFVLCVIMSDVAGYFAGRLIGGPKFWPQVSPKKTWSGTIAGWLGALVLGFIALNFNHISANQVALFPLLAFAAQMGDSAESAIKRKFNIKDSSQLIPGHGGVLDRFDGMIGAGGVVMLAQIIFA